MKNTPVAVNFSYYQYFQGHATIKSSAKVALLLKISVLINFSLATIIFSILKYLKKDKV